MSRANEPCGDDGGWAVLLDTQAPGLSESSQGCTAKRIEARTVCPGCARQHGTEHAALRRISCSRGLFIGTR